jgi:hypothetical protein
MEFITMARKPGGKNNAITHGAYAKDLLLPDECPEEFELLHRGLIEEWNPTGTLQNDTVLDFAQCVWTKRRNERFYHREATGGQFQDVDEIRFVIYLAKMLDVAPTLEEATAITAYLPEAYQKWIAEQAPQSGFKDAKSWIQSVKQRILDLAAGHASFAKATESMAYKANKATYLRELTAEKITLDERLDARIDKAIKRLAQLKAFKQIEAEQASRARTIDQHSIANHRPQTSTN